MFSWRLSGEEESRKRQRGSEVCSNDVRGHPYPPRPAELVEISEITSLFYNYSCTRSSKLWLNELDQDPPFFCHAPSSLLVLKRVGEMVRKCIKGIWKCRSQHCNIYANSKPAFIRYKINREREFQRYNQRLTFRFICSSHYKIRACLVKRKSSLI